MDKDKKLGTEDLRLGQICEHIKSHKRYLIVDVCKDFYECLAVSGIEKAIYEPKYIYKIDAILSNNQNLAGIKWFEENKNFENLCTDEVLNEIFEMQNDYLNKKFQEKTICKKKVKTIF